MSGRLVDRVVDVGARAAELGDSTSGAGAAPSARPVDSRALDAAGRRRPTGSWCCCGRCPPWRLGVGHRGPRRAPPRRPPSKSMPRLSPWATSEISPSRITARDREPQLPPVDEVELGLAVVEPGEELTRRPPRRSRRPRPRLAVLPSAGDTEERASVKNPLAQQGPRGGEEVGHDDVEDDRQAEEEGEPRAPDRRSATRARGADERRHVGGEDRAERSLEAPLGRAADRLPCASPPSTARSRRRRSRPSCRPTR